MGARFKFPFIEVSLDAAPSFFHLLMWIVNRSLFIGTHFLIRQPSVPLSWASVLIIVTHFHIRYSIVLFSTSGGRRSSGWGNVCPAPALTYSFTAIASDPPSAPTSRTWIDFSFCRLQPDMLNLARLFHDVASNLLFSLSGHISVHLPTSTIARLSTAREPSLLVCIIWNWWPRPHQLHPILVFVWCNYHLNGGGSSQTISLQKVQRNRSS